MSAAPKQPAEGRFFVHALGMLVLSSHLVAPQSITAAMVEWDGGGDGSSWNDADNWEPSGVPTAADDVTIDNFAVEIVGIPASAGSVDAFGGSLFVGRDLTVQSASFVENLGLQAVLENSSQFTISGMSGWTNGEFKGAGSVTNSGGFVVNNIGTPRKISDKTFVNNGTMTVDQHINFMNANLSNTGMLELRDRLNRVLPDASGLVGRLRQDSFLFRALTYNRPPA